MSELFFTLLPSVATMLIGWILGRRQQVAVTKTTELDNVEKAIQIWRSLSADLEDKLNAAIARNEILEQELDAAKTLLTSIVKNCPNGCPEQAQNAKKLNNNKVEQL